MYYIAVFASRTESMRFQDILMNNGVMCSLINTPREASVGCGVCVKFNPADFKKVRDILVMHRNLSLVSFFKVMKNGRGFLVSRI